MYEREQMYCNDCRKAVDIKIVKDVFGADADGNRGQKVIDYDFEDTKEEREEIVEALYQRFIEQGLEIESADVEVYCNLIDENIEVSVEAENYIDDLIEKAKADKDSKKIQESIQKIILMQAQSFLLGGIPIIFYGDEVGYENDYSYLKDAGKSYDNRWMHRPIIDWKKNALAVIS